MTTLSRFLTSTCISVLRRGCVQQKVVAFGTDKYTCGNLIRFSAVAPQAYVRRPRDEFSKT